MSDIEYDTFARASDWPKSRPAIPVGSEARWRCRGCGQPEEPDAEPQNEWDILSSWHRCTCPHPEPELIPQGTGQERVIPALRAWIEAGGEPRALDPLDPYEEGYCAALADILALLDEYTTKAPSGTMER